MNQRKTYSFLLLVLFTCSLSYSYAHHNRQRRQRTTFQKNEFGPNSFDSKEFCKDLAILFAKDWLAHFMHQLGTAFANKAFTDQPVAITMGHVHPSLPLNQTNLFSIGGPPVFLLTFLPVGGETVITQTDSKLKNISRALAGPICGALTYYLLNVYSTFQKYKKHRIPWTLTKLLKESLLDADIYRHLVTNLFPINYNSGAQILKEFFPNAQTENRLYAAGAGVFLDFFVDERIVNAVAKRLNKNVHESLTTKSYLFVDKENVKMGNRFFFSFTHKLLAAIKYGWNRDDFSITDDTAFDVGDAIGLANLLLYQQYFKSLQVVYGG